VKSLTILKPPLDPTLCHTAQSRATFARHDFLFQMRTPTRSTFHASMIPINPFYPLSKIIHVRQHGRYLNYPTYFPRPSIAALYNCLDSVRITFDGCHMLCKTRKRATESIFPGNCYRGHPDLGSSCKFRRPQSKS
jgi:hypothetical protein